MTALSDPPKKSLPDAYHIEFDTKQFAGMIVATRVTIQSEVIRDHNATMRVDLSAHPLYRKLWAYCVANPPPGVRKKRP